MANGQNRENFYRAEAYAHYVAGHLEQGSEVVLRTPTWLTYSFWGLVALCLAALAYGSMATVTGFRVSQGMVIASDGSIPTLVAAVPSAPQPSLREGDLLQIRMANGSALPFAVVGVVGQAAEVPLNVRTMAETLRRHDEAIVWATPVQGSEGHWQGPLSQAVTVQIPVSKRIVAALWPALDRWARETGL